MSKSPNNTAAYTPVSDQSIKNTLTEPKQSHKSSRGSKNSTGNGSANSLSQKSAQSNNASNSTSKTTSPRESVKTKRSTSKSNTSPKSKRPVDNKLSKDNLTKENADIKSFLNQQPLDDPEEAERAALAAEQTRKDKKIARAVMVVAGLLLVMCFILVGATLSLSDHIDALVNQKKNDLFKSWDSSNADVNETVAE